MKVEYGLIVPIIALPRIAVEEAHEAIAWKIALYHLTTELFLDIPWPMKCALGRVIGVPAEDIILGNSDSYGLHLLANGIPWRVDDEAVLVKGDFPSDILPWLALKKGGQRLA